MTSIPEMCLYAILATGVGLGARKMFETLRPVVAFTNSMHPDFERFCVSNSSVPRKEMTINGNKSDPDVSPEEMVSGDNKSSVIDSKNTDAGDSCNINPKEVTLGGKSPHFAKGKEMTYVDVIYSDSVMNDIKRALSTVATKIDIGSSRIDLIEICKSDKVEEKLKILRNGDVIYAVVKTLHPVKI